MYFCVSIFFCSILMNSYFHQSNFSVSYLSVIQNREGKGKQDRRERLRIMVSSNTSIK